MIALAVRLYALDRFSYGLDEILQTYWLQGTWGFFWRSLRFDAVHPPLDYLVSRVVEGLHPSGWLRKVPDVLWGTGTVAAMGALLARRAGRAAGLLTALLLAMAPFHIRYSQELRPYSLGLFLFALSVLALDRFLERPSALRLTSLYAACLATAYSLYVAGIALAIASGALLVEDAFSLDPLRRRTARRFLLFSPLFALALFLAYLPWWPVVLEAARRPAPVSATPLTWGRVARTLAFFGFAPNDGMRLRGRDVVFLLLVSAGLAAALSRRGTRFLAAWGVCGLAVIEALSHIHPHWDATRRYLPAGLVFPALLALGILAIGRRSRPRALRVAAVASCLAVVLTLDGGGIRDYFRNGRPDWRPLGQFLRRRPAAERVFTENQYTQLCTAFYTVGPRWLFEQGNSGPATAARPILNLEGEIRRLTWSWPPGATAWLVVASGEPSRELRRWAGLFPETSFASAEGGRVYRLDPGLRSAALAGR